MIAFSTYTDQELFSLISKGDQGAFHMIYKRHWADLYKLASFILRDQDASKDIIQDIFVWIWEHKKDLQIQSPKSYLRVAVKFKIANHIRSGNIRKSFFEELADYESSASLPGSDEVTELRELNNIIQQAISVLPFKCREIFRLRREGNFSNKEIAEKLHISIKTVENQMTIANRRIRSAVEPYMVCLLLFMIIHYNYPLDFFYFF